MIPPMYIAVWFISLTIGMVVSMVMDHVTSEKEDATARMIYKNKPKHSIIEESVFAEYQEEDNTEIDNSINYLNDSVFDMFDKNSQ